MNELTTLIQQALDNGDTATARALSRALENQTRISTIPVQQEEYYPQQQYLTPQYTHTQPLDVYYEPVEYYEPVPSRVSKYSQFKSFRISYLLIGIMAYAAIAQMAAPGTDKYNWSWGWDVTVGQIINEN